MDKQLQIQADAVRIYGEMCAHSKKNGLSIVPNDLARNFKSTHTLGIPYAVSGEYTDKYLKQIDDTFKFMFGRWGAPKRVPLVHFHFQAFPEQSEQPGMNVSGRNRENNALLNYQAVIINTTSKAQLDSVIPHETIHCADDLLNITYNATKDKDGRIFDIDDNLQVSGWGSGNHFTESARWNEKMLDDVINGVIDHQDQPKLMQRYIEEDYNLYNDSYHHEGFVTQIFRDMKSGASHREALCVAHGMHQVFAGALKSMRRSGKFRTKTLRNAIHIFLESIPKGPYYPQIRHDMKRYAGSLM